MTHVALTRLTQLTLLRSLRTLRSLRCVRGSDGQSFNFQRVVNCGKLLLLCSFNHLITLFFWLFADIFNVFDWCAGLTSAQEKQKLSDAVPVPPPCACASLLLAPRLLHSPSGPLGPAVKPNAVPSL